MGFFLSFASSKKGFMGLRRQNDKRLWFVLLLDVRMGKFCIAKMPYVKQSSKPFAASAFCAPAN
jgi:hypothetical protein